jgi:hypothetical protein
VINLLLRVREQISSDTQLCDAMAWGDSLSLSLARLFCAWEKLQIKDGEKKSFHCYELVSRAHTLLMASSVSDG